MLKYDDRKELPFTYALGYLIGIKYGENFDKTVIDISNNILRSSDFGLKAKETAVMMLRCTTEQRYEAIQNFLRIANGLPPPKEKGKRKERR
jgi:hypothetical protein